MFDTPSELMENIGLGEDSFLELKELRVAGDKISDPRRDDLADELAAFANSRGGVCVLGVNDKTREVIGIPRDLLNLAEEFVREICQNSIEPPLNPVIERLALPNFVGENLPVLKVEIPRSLFVHQSPGGYFHRVGSSKRRMKSDFLARLFQQRSQVRFVRFDEQAVSVATVSDLDAALWQRFRTPRSGGDGEDLLRKLGMAAVDEDGTTRPTVAGVLMATRDPRNWLPNAYIQAVAYRGHGVVPESGRPDYQVDAKDISGPLDHQVAEACRFVLRNMRMGADKTAGRHDRPQFDLTAVFEAVVNAVAHRDYAIYGSKIRLRLFSDRLELYSPGTIPNSMTVEGLPYRQAARNETLTSLLAKCPVPDDVSGLETDRSTLMDKRGEGVQIILENSERLSGKRPEYRLIDDAELLLVIHAPEPKQDTVS